MWIDHNVFMHSCFDGHLGCSHLLAIVNCAATNLRVHVFEHLLLILLDINLGVELLDHTVTLCLVF